MKKDLFEIGNSPNKSPDVPALDDSTFYGRESGIMYKTDSGRRPSIPGYFNASGSGPNSPLTFYMPQGNQHPMTPGISHSLQQQQQQQPMLHTQSIQHPQQMQAPLQTTPPIPGQQPMPGGYPFPPSDTSAPNMVSSSTNPRSLVTTASGKVRSRPCDACRKCKARCQTEPNATQCNKCASRGIPCTFLENVRPKRRRIESGSPENTNNNVTSQNSAPVSSANNSTSNNTPTETDKQQPEDGITLKDTLPVSDYSSLPGKSLLKKTLSLQYPKSSFYVGHTSVHDIRFFDTATLDNIGQCVLNKDTAMRRVAPDVLFTIRNDFADDLHSEFIANSDQVERIVAPHGLALIDLYFRIVHPAFPILHKRIFMEKYARTHREFSPPLLAAVYILALKWWNYEPQLASQPKPDVEKLRRIALNSFSDLYEQPKLSVVQAGLLILQCSMERARSWILISHVISLAEELGLGMDCQTWRLPRWERALRRRLAWAVYIQDKWVALIEGRPSHIDESRQWLVRKISAEDFPDRPQTDDSDIEGSLDTENGRLLFMEMVRLSEIVSEILDTFFTMVAKRNLTDTAAILTKAKPIQIKLRDWHRGLPECLRMSNTKPRRLNSNGYLHLAYFAAEITLHRRIIRSLSDSLPDQIVSVCREAAKARLLAAIELVDTLKHEHIQAFWHSSAATNFALIGSFAALLYVTSRDDTERSFYREQLLNYRWILRVGCKGFDEMGLALDKLEEAISQVPGLNDPPKEDVSYGDEEYSDEVGENDNMNETSTENGGDRDQASHMSETNDNVDGERDGGSPFDPADIDLEKLVSEMNQ
ncbi:Transcriptional activator protein [Yarrowia sp. C11]|nr:Transcriptional activator protein [Yarrowia sp. E02]KAG5369116.1 Transcriptional activator protein [Yarrowia sp. C11]